MPNSSLSLDSLSSPTPSPQPSRVGLAARQHAPAPAVDSGSDSELSELTDDEDPMDVYDAHHHPHSRPHVNEQPQPQSPHGKGHNDRNTDDPVVRRAEDSVSIEESLHSSRSSGRRKRGRLVPPTMWE